MSPGSSYSCVSLLSCAVPAVLESFELHSSCEQECTPFAVIGSNTVVEARGQRVRGRLYPWGIVEGTFLSPFILNG